MQSELPSQFKFLGFLLPRRWIVAPTVTDELSQETMPTDDATEAELDDNVAELWKGFDKKAKVYVDELVESLSNQLDNLLLFAGLFSAINTALLVYTLPTLSPSPQAQTNALLYLLVQGFNNSTLSALGDAAATNPSPTTPMVRVNALFTASLTCSLIASFSAVLGKQWLIYYSRSLYSSPEERRREQQRKIMGADRWHLHGILEVGLLSLLQAALLLFTVGLVIFLQTINQTIALINKAITAVGLAALVGSTFIALWDDSCPYQSSITMSLIPDFCHFIIWLILVITISTSFLPIFVANFFVAGYSAVRWRFSEFQTKMFGQWNLLVINFGTSGYMLKNSAMLYRYFARFLRREVEDSELNAASLAWLVVNTQDKAEFNGIIEAIPAINERKALDRFGCSYATDQYLRPILSKETDGPELAGLTTSCIHVFVATLDVTLFWFVPVANKLVEFRPVVDSSEGPTESDRDSGSKPYPWGLPVPTPLYIAAALRSILDLRVYWTWRFGVPFRFKIMDELDARLCPRITSCASPFAPPRVVSMVALALKITIGKKANRPPPRKEARRTQKADYEAIWSSCMSDEPFIKNLAGGVLCYAEHRKAPPEKVIWPSESQVTNLLLASHSYIDTEASMKQLERDGLDLIRGCANLLGSLTGPDEEVQDGDMIAAAGELIDVTIKRAISLGDPSTKMLTVEVEMLGTLAQLYHNYRSSPILDSFYCLFEHCQSHIVDTPAHSPRMASRQSSLVIAAAGRILETLVAKEVGYLSLATKVTNFIEKIVEKTLIDWADEGTSTTWASGSTMLAMVQYIKHLLDQGDVRANRQEFTAAYATTVENPRWQNLSDERTRLELRGVLGRLQEFVDREKTSPAGDKAEVVPLAELTYLE